MASTSASESCAPQRRRRWPPFAIRRAIPAAAIARAALEKNPVERSKRTLAERAGM